VTVLLPTDQVELYAPGAADEHGWRLPPRGDPDWRWCGPGSLQLAPGPSDPRATEGGGAGPFSPGARQAGALYLPPEAQPAEGMAAVIRGQVWVLSQVRYVKDPNDLGGFLDCWASTVTEAPADG
jgi:hypothetical protein